MEKMVGKFMGKETTCWEVENLKYENGLHLLKNILEKRNLRVSLINGEGSSLEVMSKSKRSALLPDVFKVVVFINKKTGEACVVRAPKKYTILTAGVWLFLVAIIIVIGVFLGIYSLIIGNLERSITSVSISLLGVGVVVLFYFFFVSLVQMLGVISKSLYQDSCDALKKYFGSFLV